MKQKGFTITEMIITTLLVGVLATVGFTSYQNSLNKAHDTQKIAMLATIEKLVLADKASDSTFKYDSTETLLTALKKGGLDFANAPVKKYFYFGTDIEYSIVTCLADGRGFSRGSFVKRIDCESNENSLAKSLTANSFKEIPDENMIQISF